MREQMKTIDLNQIELTEFIGVTDSRQHCKATFPLLGAHGSENIAAVYFEIDPGDNLGKHTDSAEELLVILAGDLTVTIGEITVLAKSGQMILVPAMESHNIHNNGIQKAKVLGVFGGANNIVATFEQAWLPTHSNVVDTATL
jgi:quercetin dioxygenase-like cupin family protein